MQTLGFGKSFGRAAQFAMAAAVLAFAGGAIAAQEATKDKTVKDQAKDVAVQPLEDVNLKKHEIPPELQKILDNPYASGTLKTCSDLTKAINELTGVLGPDLDAKAVTDLEKSKRDIALGLAGDTVANMIVPMRGVVREVSGAASAERKYRVAIYAGTVRRGYLKGLGEARGCKPPAAPIKQGK